MAFSPKDASRVIVTEQFVSPNTDKDMRALLQQTEGVLAESRRNNYLEEDPGVLYLRGNIKRFEGDTKAALALYVQAADMVERDRRKLRDERSRGSFSEGQLLYYNTAILELLQRGKQPGDRLEFWAGRRNAGITRCKESAGEGALWPLEPQLNRHAGCIGELETFTEETPISRILQDLEGQVIEIIMGDDHKPIAADAREGGLDEANTVLTDGVREDDLKAGLAGADLVHLAMHGKFNATEPMLSHLKLSAGGKDDGQLTAAEMFALPLANSRLVVLSGCETGRAEASRGNELQGMARALIYAGAPALLLSQWRVDSESTALWMQTFYQSALSRSIPAAARDALSRVRANPAYRHPHYWAAFTVISR